MSSNSVLMRIKKCKLVGQEVDVGAVTLIETQMPLLRKEEDPLNRTVSLSKSGSDKPDYKKQNRWPHLAP